MTRDEFLATLTAELQRRQIPCRRYTVEDGLEDIEISVDGVTHRLRTLRTGQH